MVHSGARYVCVQDDVLVLLEFTKVTDGKESQSLDASLKVLPRNSKSMKINKRFAVWAERTI